MDWWSCSLLSKPLVEHVLQVAIVLPSSRSVKKCPQGRRHIWLASPLVQQFDVTSGTTTSTLLVRCHRRLQTNCEASVSKSVYDAPVKSMKRNLSALYSSFHFYRCKQADNYSGRKYSAFFIKKSMLTNVLSTEHTCQMCLLWRMIFFWLPSNLKCQWPQTHQK